MEIYLGGSSMAKFQHLLVTTDFSERAESGVETARELAKDLNARLSLLHVLEEILPSITFSSPAQRLEIQEAQATESRQKLDEYVAQNFPEGDVHPVLRTGTPYREILACIEEVGADLVVMSSQGRGSVGQIVFGSTTARILRMSPCPVLVAAQPQQPDSEVET